MIVLVVDRQRYVRVAERLYLGPSPRAATAISRHFSAVLDCRSTERDPSDADVYARRGVAYYRLAVDAKRDAPDEREIAAALSWLQHQLAAGRRCLVHCDDGLGYSLLVAGRYLLPRMNGDVRRVRNHLERCRSGAGRSTPILRRLHRRSAHAGREAGDRDDENPRERGRDRPSVADPGPRPGSATRRPDASRPVA